MLCFAWKYKISSSKLTVAVYDLLTVHQLANLHVSSPISLLTYPAFLSL